MKIRVKKKTSAPSHVIITSIGEAAILFCDSDGKVIFTVDVTEEQLNDAETVRKMINDTYYLLTT